MLESLIGMEILALQYYLNNQKKIDFHIPLIFEESFFQQELL